MPEAQPPQPISDERLLYALARAYIREHGLDHAQTPAKPDAYAKWVWRQRRNELVRNTPVRIRLTGADILELIGLRQRVAELEWQLRLAREEADGMWSTYAEAREIMRGGEKQEVKLRKVAKLLGFIGLRRRDPETLRFQYDQLLSGHFDPETNQQRGPMEPDEAINVLMTLYQFPSFGAARKALQRAGAKRLPQDR